MIPKGWKEFQLENIADIILSNVDKIIKADEKSVKLCNYLDVYNNFYITNGFEFMQGSANEREIQKCSLFKDDVIITKDSETPQDIANAAVVAEDLENTVCGYHLAIIRPNKKIVDGTFLMYQFHHQPVNNQFVRLANGITRFGLTKSTIEHAKIPIPPLAEQKRIAEVLGAWDEAITLTDRLIKAQEQRKKGLMQWLLTGKVRLSGFEGEWQKKHLGEVFKNRRERGFNHLPLLAVTADKGVVYRDTLDRRDTSNADKSNYLRVCPNDIAYNTMRMWQGRSGVSTLEGVVSPAYTVIIPKDTVDINYMGHLFKYQPIVHTFWKYSQGLVSDTLNLKYSAFAKIKLSIPPLPEQKAIAAILQTADEEIRLNKEKLKALRQQKKGLMQQLLTGKIRLKT